MDHGHIGFGLELQLGSESHWIWVGTAVRVLNGSLTLGLGWHCN
jgi:hypothetical protein